jgi:hypothetical protein
MTAQSIILGKISNALQTIEAGPNGRGGIDDGRKRVSLTSKNNLDAYARLEVILQMAARAKLAVTTREAMAVTQATALQTEAMGERGRADQLAAELAAERQLSGGVQQHLAALQAKLADAERQQHELRAVNAQLQSCLPSAPPSPGPAVPDAAAEIAAAVVDKVVTLAVDDVVGSAAAGPAPPPRRTRSRGLIGVLLERRASPESSPDAAAAPEVTRGPRGDTPRRLPARGGEHVLQVAPQPPAAAMLGGGGRCRHSIAASNGASLQREAAKQAGDARSEVERTRREQAEQRLEKEQRRREAAEVAVEEVAAVAVETEALRAQEEQATAAAFEQMHAAMDQEIGSMQAAYEETLHHESQRAEGEAADRVRMVERMAEEVALQAAAAIERQRVSEVGRLEVLLDQSEKLREQVLAEMEDAHGEEGAGEDGDASCIGSQLACHSRGTARAASTEGKVAAGSRGGSRQRSAARSRCASALSDVRTPSPSPSPLNFNLSELEWKVEGGPADALCGLGQCSPPPPVKPSSRPTPSRDRNVRGLCVDIPGEEFSDVATRLHCEAAEVDATELVTGVVAGVVHKAVRWVKSERHAANVVKNDVCRQAEATKEPSTSEPVEQLPDDEAVAARYADMVAAEARAPILTPGIDELRSARGYDRYQ